MRISQQSQHHLLDFQAEMCANKMHVQIFFVLKSIAAVADNRAAASGAAAEELSVC